VLEGLNETEVKTPSNSPYRFARRRNFTLAGDSFDGHFSRLQIEHQFIHKIGAGNAEKQ
jgi:hypothetical protein